MQSLLSQSRPVIIIPAYQPSDELLQLIEKITVKYPEQKFIIVNDGSSHSSLVTLNKLVKYSNVIVLHHAVNLGKGQALKTAFNYFLLHFPESVGVITADADGQHSASDIENIQQHFCQDPTILWLGSRKLNKAVPLRSRFGNGLTRKIFQFIVGKKVYDTQTGLRAIPKSALSDLLRIPTSRYEYELDMLICAIRKKIDIRELPIEVIYIDGNKSSHFNPVFDSLKVYFVFLRYIAASLSSAVLDFLSFVILHFFSNQIFLSLAGARLISGTFNFLLCKKMIFKSGANIYSEAFKYIMLALFSLLLSYILVLGFVNDYGMDLYVSKILADVCVFLINFAIQKVMIFPVSATRE